MDAGAPIFGAQAQILNDKGKLELMPSRILRQGQARTVGSAGFALSGQIAEVTVTVFLTARPLINLSGF